jgi:hypothetical protein
MKTDRRGWGSAAALLALTELTLSGCQLDNHQAVVTPPPTPAITVSYFARVESYATTLGQQIGGGGDPQTVVVPASVAYPPGTILVAGAAAVDICPIPPAAFFAPDPAIAWMPPEGVDRSFAFSFALPATLLGGLFDANAKVNLGHSTALDFEDLTQHVALLSPFQQALGAPDCAARIAAARRAGKTVTVIRGSISGKESFTFDQNPGATIGASAQTVGNFSITLAPNKQAIAMHETAPAVHFLMTYNIPPGGAAPMPPPTTIAGGGIATAEPPGKIMPAAPVVAQLNPTAALAPATAASPPATPGSSAPPPP